METTSTLAALAALAQETRLSVFRLLVEAGPTGLSVGEIAASVKASPATLSFHLKELAHARLIEARQRAGRCEIGLCKVDARRSAYQFRDIAAIGAHRHQPCRLASRQRQ